MAMTRLPLNAHLEPLARRIEKVTGQRVVLGVVVLNRLWLREPGERVTALDGAMILEWERQGVTLLEAIQAARVTYRMQEKP